MPPLCSVLVIPRRGVRVPLRLGLWPRGQNAGHGVEKRLDLLLREPLFTLLHHLQKETSEGYGRAAQAESGPALPTHAVPGLLASGVPGSGPGSRAPRGSRSSPSWREGGRSRLQFRSHCSKWVEAKSKLQVSTFPQKNRKLYQSYIHPRAHVSLLYVPRKLTSGERNGPLHTSVLHKHSCNSGVLPATHLTVAHCVPEAPLLRIPTPTTGSSSGSSRA